jgi:hypothetical protein
MQAGTTPKKRTSLNGRAALKLMRLDGARGAHQAASNARVTKAVSSIAVGLLLISSGASATECQSSPGHDGKWSNSRAALNRPCFEAQGHTLFMAERCKQAVPGAPAPLASPSGIVRT